MPNITKRFVDAAEPGRWYDERLAGFGLYVGSTGARSYFFEYRPGRGRGVAKRRISIGKHGSPWTPDTARNQAHEHAVAVKAGRDPLDERATMASMASKGRTVSSVVEEWLRRDQAKNRSLREVTRVMHHDVLPVWGELEFAAIRKRDVIELIDGIADRGAGWMANRTLGHLRRMFNWAAGRDMMELNPAQRVEKPAPEPSRERVLTDDELARIAHGAASVGNPYGNIVRLLMLTGARREEIRALRWAEVDLNGNAIRLPASRVKTKIGRTIPLSPAAVRVIRAVPRISGSEWVFSVSGRVPYANLSEAKIELDRRIARQRADARLGNSSAAEKEPGCAETMEPWRLHDLRRTLATGLQRLGIRLETIETVLGHISGSRGGVIGTYQRHKFEEEAREALVAWSAHIERLLSGSPGASVVPLRRTL